MVVAPELDVDEQQPAAAIQEHDVVVVELAVVEVEAARADKHEPALRSESDSDCIQDNPQDGTC